MLDQTDEQMLLKRIGMLEREVERFRRDLLHSLARKSQVGQEKPSLFGSVHAGDVTDDMIRQSQQALFRSLEDL